MILSRVFVTISVTFQLIGVEEDTWLYQVETNLLEVELCLAEEERESE